MASPEGPLLHRRRLGVELRALRGERTLDEVAEATLISTSKLSRLEKGQGVPQARDIRDLVALYELDTATADRLRSWASAGRSQAWWRDYSAVLPATLETYLDYESGASTIRAYASAAVPSLLQTAEYATGVQRGTWPMKSEEAVKRLVEIQGRRQAILVESESAPRLIVTLDEAVLRRPVGLNVSLAIVPFAAGVHAGIQGSFAVLQFADDIDRDIVVIESHTAERFLEPQSNVLEYLRIFDAIRHRALDHDESRALLAEIRSTLDSPKGTT